MEKELRKCPDCGVEAGKIHQIGCDVEHCSTCGGQKLQCDCIAHDRQFSRWTGFWPGDLESKELGIGLNEFYASGIYKKILIKPND